MSDAAALSALLAAQRAAFARGAPAYQQRMAALASLRDALLLWQEELIAAVAADFGGRPREETLLLELFPLHDQIRHARKHLKRWVRRRRVRSSWFLRPAGAFIQYQPLGAVGVIGAWNYQLLLTLGPAVDAIAAGNHVMLKPSEITPRSADVLRRMIAETFPPEYVACVTGGPELAAAFSALPFDHLFFTGSTRVGRLVMQAAAAHLTPVTLELGGKSPAIVHESVPLDTAAERILTGKLYNAGQTCVAPDYVLLPAGREADFEAAARRIVPQLYPRLRDNPEYTRIVSTHHQQRLFRIIEDARTKGARVVSLGEPDAHGERSAPGDRLVPPTLIFEPTPDMLALQEEIFGPVLPVVTYHTLADAIEFVNTRPRPLALYYFDYHSGRCRSMLERTLSGGVTLNDCIIHLAQHNLPFGGVGQSGMGHYHGFDGFVTFSKKRGVAVQRRWSSATLLRPPFKGRGQAIIRAMLRLASR